MSYDIIGDIHGCSRTLAKLLEKLGYAPDNGVYRHPSRQAIFLGDFVDRGPHQREVIDIVRPMVESGTALSVMGNHEFNAIAYATRDSESTDFLRKHSEKNQNQHKAFLDAYANHSDERDDVLDWFKTLPLWLDLGGLRVVHACWDRESMGVIRVPPDRRHYLDEELLEKASRPGTEEYEALETLLKGKEIPLPGGASFKDKDGNVRHNIRIRWWDPDAKTYRDLFLGPEPARTHIPDDEISGDHLVVYSPDDPPVFLGHYWLEGTPKPLAQNIACLDYSVAKPGGKLVAYRWNGEQQLTDTGFVHIDRIENDST